MVMTEDGRGFQAFSATPTLTDRYPAIALAHDWWGLTSAMRGLAMHLCQGGFQVMIPDLFDGRTASTATAAKALVAALTDRSGYRRVAQTLDALEAQAHTNHRVGVVGMGMGANFAFRAALERHNLEAAVVLSGFPQPYAGRMLLSKTPVLAVYGADDPLIDVAAIDALQRELAGSALATQHRLVRVAGLGHDLFPDVPTDAQREASGEVVAHMIDFLAQFLAF